jgi:hypothetical protein
MSPELYARQLAAGAWGISFANVFQAGGRCVAARVRRIIIANQVMQAVPTSTALPCCCNTMRDLQRLFSGRLDGPIATD